MARIDVVVVPGIGALRAFRTAANDRIAVLALPSGRRQIFMQDHTDPDRRQLVADLSQQDAQILAELLGGPLLQMQAGDQPVAATVLDWVRVPDGGAAAGATIAALNLDSSSGATVAAVLRDDEFFAEPDPKFTIHNDDVVVLAGGTQGLADGRRILTAPGTA